MTLWLHSMCGVVLSAPSRVLLLPFPAGTASVIAAYSHRERVESAALCSIGREVEPKESVGCVAIHRWTGCFFALFLGLRVKKAFYGVSA